MTDYRTEFCDISFWQGEIDWTNLDPLIYGFFLKTSEANFKDRMYKQYASDCEKYNKEDGSYHFFRSYVKGVAQAKLAISCVTKTQELPYVLDLEAANGAGAIQVANEAKAYCETIVKDTNTIPMIYTGKGFMGMFYWYKKYIEWMKDYPLWLAEYRWEKDPQFINNFSLHRELARTGSYFPSAPYPWKQVELWQWTGHGRVTGLRGDVDMNVSAAEIVPAPPTPITTYYKVTALLGLRVRSTPSVTGTIITTLKYGSIVGISKIENDWGFSDNYNGWLSMQYLVRM